MDNETVNVELNNDSDFTIEELKKPSGVKRYWSNKLEFWKDQDPLVKKNRETVILRLVIFTVCLIAFIAITIVKNIQIDKQRDQQVARVWREKAVSSSQVSVFFDETKKVDEMTVRRLKHSLLENLVNVISDASYDENNLDRTPFYMAYSGKGSATISVDDNANNLAVYGVGGDFFTFHNLTIISGDYFFDSVNDEYVLLDSVSAFKLYGSKDIIGEKVMINKHQYTICGVYRVDNDVLTKKADADSGFVFMPYSALLRDGSVAGITCIEVAGESPTEEYLLEKVNESIKSMYSDSEFESIKNTDRYGFLNTIKTLKGTFYRSMRKKNVSLPYWENIARAREDIFAFWFVVQAVLLTIIVGMVVIYICYKYAHKTWSMKLIGDRLYDIADDIRCKRRNRIGK